jgi:hypothetical protein
MKDFFAKKPYEYMDKDAELISIALRDSKGNIVKGYCKEN